MILVDGMPRSGKSLIASAFSAVPPFEPWQLPISVDHVVKYLELGMFSTVEARAALLISLNSSTFDYAVGRGLNRRKWDNSSIFNTHSESSLSMREQNPDYSAIIKESEAKSNIPVIVTHDNISILSFWLEAVSTANVIETIRNPASLMVSWHKRSMVDRWGSDPLMFVPCLDINGQPLPVYAQNHVEEWLKSDSLERLLLSAEIQYAEIIAAVNALSEDAKKRVRFVQIETFKKYPTQAIAQLLSWLGVTFSANHFSTFCEIEKLPRESVDSQVEADKKFLIGLLPANLHSRLDSLISEYELTIASSLEKKAPYFL